jgi:hypothetical protein
MRASLGSQHRLTQTATRNNIHVAQTWESHPVFARGGDFWVLIVTNESEWHRLTAAPGEQDGRVDKRYRLMNLAELMD